ncbi:YveK family protein [Carnobacterium maltaromaticum]|uniref:YveK family protein n=1 Tax=Carnobacterium maltaromaticum TaxID=2751 RepID=UPI0039BDA494
MSKIKTRIFHDFFRVCKKYYFIILLVPCLVTSIVYLLTVYVIPENYEAKTQLLVSIQNENNEQRLDELRSSIQLLGTFSSITQSQRIMNQAAMQLNQQVIHEKLSVSIDENSLIVTLKARGENKKSAVLVVNTIADLVAKDFSNLFKGADVTILEKANIANQPSILFQLILAMITGVFSALAFLFFLSISNLVISNEEQIKELGLIYLGDVTLIKK